VAHSDRGGRYAGEHYRRPLGGHGIARGMSRRADRRDNAPMGSSFASLKEGPTRGEVFATGAEAGASTFEHIEAFSNRVRRHPSPGYMSPVEYERAG
jgi:putative transposase